jgi:hypothetical protein
MKQENLQYLKTDRRCIVIIMTQKDETALQRTTAAFEKLLPFEDENIEI